MSIIYHYTDVNGFFGIMQNKKLWLSSAACMNDSQEVKQGFKLLKNVLDSASNEENKAKFDFFWEFSILNMQYPYICSFSKKGDLLSQWRAYAQDGFGVSIGFEREAFNFEKQLPFTHTNIKHTFGLVDIIYDEEVQKQRFLSLVHDYQSETFEKPVLAAQYSYIFKNPAFTEEDEVRIIHTPLLAMLPNEHSYSLIGNYGDVKHRVSGSSITSYFELDFEPNQVKEIILGPKCQFDETELRKFLATNEFKQVKIKRSTASYR